MTKTSDDRGAAATDRRELLKGTAAAARRLIARVRAIEETKNDGELIAAMGGRS